MDPLTLFALANGAVAAVKQGCALYNEMRGAVNDVKGVIQDLDSQFNARYKDRKPTVAEKNQYVQEKNRIIELSKKQPDDVFTEIGQQLGVYFENMATCMAIFEEDARNSDKVYSGTDSIGKRALQRVLMESRLQAMQSELREIMVYQSPPELGDLYTRVERMMVQIKREQSIAISIKNKNDRISAAQRRRRIDYIKTTAIEWTVGIIAVFCVVSMIWCIIEVRKEQHPELGVCLVPKGTWPYDHYNKLKWIECEPR